MKNHLVEIRSGERVKSPDIYIYIYISMVRQERDERYASAVSATSIDSERPPYL